MAEAAELEALLHREIPLAGAMGVSVRAAGPDGATLAAPLGPNVNHKRTAFGGSLASLATLAGWTWAQWLLRDAGLAAQLVIQESRTEYRRAVGHDFAAVCVAPEPTVQRRFLAAVERYGRGRLSLVSEIRDEGQLAVWFEGRYAALRP